MSIPRLFKYIAAPVLLIALFFVLFTYHTTLWLPKPQAVIDTIREALPQNISLPNPLIRKDPRVKGGVLTSDGIFHSTNRARESAGRTTFTRNAALDKIAQSRVQDMFKKNYFAHISPDGTSVSDVAKKQGYAYLAIGENIALGFFADDQALVQAWMDSPGHRENILDSRFTEIGSAAEKGRYGDDELWIAAQIFSRPQSACPSPDTRLKEAIIIQKEELARLDRQAEDLKSALGSPPSSEEEYEFYKKRIDAYNALVKILNSNIRQVKDMVRRYNEQIDAFNTCVKN
jgi:hypothetical protein